MAAAAAPPARRHVGHGPGAEQQPSGGKAAGDKASGWVSTHKGLVLGIMVVVLALLYFVSRSRGGGTNVDASPAALTPAPPIDAGGTAGGGDASGGDALSQILASEAGITAGLGNILAAIQSLKASPVPTGSPAPGSHQPPKPPHNSGFVMHPGPPPARRKVPTSAAHVHRATTPKFPHVYTVRRGDTLSGIAARLRIRGGYKELYRDNRGTIGRNANMIHPGQVLHY